MRRRSCRDAGQRGLRRRTADSTRRRWPRSIHSQSVLRQPSKCTNAHASTHHTSPNTKRESSSNGEVLVSHTNGIDTYRKWATGTIDAVCGWIFGFFYFFFSDLGMVVITERLNGGGLGIYRVDSWRAFISDPFWESMRI